MQLILGLHLFHTNFSSFIGIQSRGYCCGIFRYMHYYTLRCLGLLPCLPHLVCFSFPKIVSPCFHILCTQLPFFAPIPPVFGSLSPSHSSFIYGVLYIKLDFIYEKNAFCLFCFSMNDVQFHPFPCKCQTLIPL